MTDPQWTVEFTVYNNRTKAQRSVRSENDTLPVAVNDVLGAVQAMLAPELERFGAQLDRLAEQMPDLRPGPEAGTPQ